MKKSLKKKLRRREFVFISSLILVLIVLTIAIFNPLPSATQTALSPNEATIYSHVNTTKITKITETQDTITLRYSWITDGTSNFCSQVPTTLKFNSGDYELTSNKVTLNNIKNQFDIETTNIFFSNIKNSEITNKKAICNLVFIDNKPIMSCDISAKIKLNSAQCITTNADGYADIIIKK